MMKMATLIRRERRKRNLTQQELADKIGVHQVTVANWETGNAEPSPHSQLLLEREFGKPLKHHSVPAPSSLTAAPADPAKIA